MYSIRSFVVNSFSPYNTLNDEQVALINASEKIPHRISVRIILDFSIYHGYVVFPLNISLIRLGI